MKKALVVRLSSLGDVALTSVLIDPLIERGYMPFLLTFKPYDQLFEDDRRITAIGATRSDLFSEELLKELREKRFDLLIDVHRNLRTFLLRRKLRGRWILYRKSSIRRRLSVRIRSLRKVYYVTESYLRVLGEPGGPAKPRIIVSEERLKRLRELLPEERFVALGPGARYRKKRYPYFKELADLFIESGFGVVWIGDEEDRRALGSVKGVNLCGKLSIPDVLGVLSISLLFVGNDSGLLHCARAVGTPSVQIYGGTHPTLGFSLYPEEGRVVIKNLDCQPCDIHGKGNCRFGDYRCLEIEPSYVFGEAMKVLSLNRERTSLRKP